MSVSIKYKGNEIASMTDDGTKTLQTKGKYCEDNITVTQTTLPPVEPNDITFWDYDGTVVAAWSLAELAGKTALPDYPAHEGLICQGWNWTLADIKAANRELDVGALYITDDGKTRLYITLQEGRTSPMLGVCPNGTVTVDWGDGTTPDTLTGTSTATVKWTPKHNYAAPGDYVIKLTVVSGSAALAGLPDNGGGTYLLRHTSDKNNINNVYSGAIKLVEIGERIEIKADAFRQCSCLESVTIPAETIVDLSDTFYSCRRMGYVAIPKTTSIVGQYAFADCSSLRSASLPKITTFGQYCLTNCFSIRRVNLSSEAKEIDYGAFSNCYNLSSLKIPSGVTTIPGAMLANNRVLCSVKFEGNISTLGTRTFAGCSGAAFYDFTSCLTVPALSNANAFEGIPADCEIRVPAALADEWKAATNWATYADQIVGV